MDPTKDPQEQLELFDISEEDIGLLHEIRPVLEKHAGAIVEDLHEHLLTYEEARVFLDNPIARERIALKNKEYLLSLGDPVDESYVNERVRIGHFHKRINLPTQYYLGAYAFYGSRITELIMKEFANNPSKATRASQAIMKLIMFDAQISLNTYIESREEALHNEHDELEREYQEQGEELEATIQRAHEAEELAAIAGLVAGLAHEVGTPMNVIQGHAELLELSVKSEKDRKRLQTIQDQIARIAKIIHALLKMARGGEHGVGPIQLESTLETSLGFLEERFRLHGINVKASLAKTSSFQGDQERLQQLFLNLLLNSADAMPKGGDLSIELAQQDGQIHVNISDTGVGIREQDLRRIFQPFYSTKEAGHGNGLGLVVAKSIVEDHGGTIQVGSKLNQGTQIQISLPLRG